jgi:acyl-CoA thioesterase-2
VSLNLQTLAPMMEFRPVGDGFEADTLPTAHGAIFGAYSLFQQVLIAEQTTPGKRVLSLQTLFANGGTSGEPVQISVEKLQDGRSFSCLSVTFRQGDLVITRAEVLLTTDEDDFLRHQTPAASPLAAQGWPAASPGLWPGAAYRSAESSLSQSSLRVALDEPVTDAGVGRALVALCSEPEVMNAFIQFGGVPPAPAGRMPGSVLTQTVTLLEPIDAASGLVLHTTPTYAGQGRAHGSGQVVDDAGRLLATYNTTGVLRRPRSS